MSNKFKAISSGKIAYIEQIPDLQPSNEVGEQPTILAIHGWLDNAATFIPLMKVMPDFHWVAIDLPGHGLSSHRPPGTHYHFIDWVSDIAEFIEQMDFSIPPIIVGHSLGGLLATVFSGIYPNKLSKLVLIDAAGLYTQNDESVVADMREAMLSRTKLAQKKPNRVNLEAAVKARQQAGQLSYSAAQLLVSRNTQKEPNSDVIVWRSDPRLRARSPLRIDQHAAREIIKNISVPTLIVLGEEGYEDVKRNQQKYADCYRDLQVVTVQGHHHCHLEFPLETAEQIKKFLL